MEWIVNNAVEIIVGTVFGSGATFVVQFGLKDFLRRRLSADVEDAYQRLRQVCEPGTLNPAMPGNQTYMRADARDFVNPLGKRLSRAGFYPPSKCSVDDYSLQEWFKFLENVRISIR